MPDSTSFRRLPWRIRYGKLTQAASELRRRQAQITHLHADLVFEGPVYLGPGFALRIAESGSLRIGPGVEFRRNFLCEIAGKGKVTIGAGCTFTGMIMIQCSTSIDILEGSQLGQGCLVADGNHKFRDPAIPFLAQGYNFRPIRIGPGAAVHTNSVVVNDVGERAVIGANSVVTRPIPPFCLAVGAPARVVEYFGPPELRPPDLEDVPSTGVDSDH